jgi:hypothetical protein
MDLGWTKGSSMKAKEFIIELKKESKPRNFVAKNASLAGKAGQHKDKKKAEKQGDVKHKKEIATMESALSELSTEKLAQYKKAAGAQASAADKMGNTKKADKRFSGIVKATNKQFANDAKGVAEDKKPSNTYPQIKSPKHYDPNWIKKLSKEKLDAIAGPRYKKDKKEQGMAERVRDPEDWDEGNTEPPNNFAVYINGKKWKVFKGRGRYADDNREQAHYQQLKDWAAKKSASTGKQWTVSITGETATESVEETSNMPFAGAKVGHKEGPAGQWRNDGAKKNKPARPGDLVGGGM